MERSRPVDGFRLAYERSGGGPAAVLLHGWPGDHGDHRAVTGLLGARADVVVPEAAAHVTSLGEVVALCLPADPNCGH